LGGGVLIMTAISLGIAYQADSFPHPAKTALVLLKALSWPLAIFGRIFPPDLEAPSPADPTPEAILGTLVTDLLVYTLVAYGLIAIIDRIRRRPRP
jgi:hypothetical protein